MDTRFDPYNQLIIFMHIPKCGGTSVHNCLELMLPDRYEVVSPKNPLDNISSDVWGIGGHFSFNGIPGRILNGRQPVYMTILRHPIERMISFFKHVAARKEHYAHASVEGFDEKRPYQILRAWQQLGFREIENLATQMITNRDPQSASANLALRNLTEHYRFVSTADSITEMLDELAVFIGAEKPTLDNLNKAALKIDNLRTPEFIDEILRLNQKDLLLYREISTRLAGKRTRLGKFY